MTDPSMSADAAVVGLWQHVARRFWRFLAQLAPDPADRPVIDRAAADVADLLARRHVAGRGRGGPPARAQIVGSHAKDTAIAGPATVDLAFLGLDRLADGRAIAAALREVTDRLCQRYGTVAMADGGLVVQPGPKVAGEHVRVRILPGIALADGGIRVYALARRPQVPWLTLRPQAEAAYLDRIDRLAEGKARHLVRLVKAWQRTLAVPLSGFAIELLCCEFLAAWLYRRRSYLFYDWMVRDFFFWLAAQPGRVLPVPGDGDPIAIGAAWLAEAEAAHAAAREAADLERENASVAALGHWRRIFGLAIGDAADQAAALPAAAFIPARP
jgi:hypothetical protein